MHDEQDQGVPASPSLSQPSASDPDGSSQSGIANAEDFDSARITEMVATIEAKVLAPFAKKAADEFYCQVMETAEDYLRDNLDWNLRSHLEMLQRENLRMRTELYEVDRLLGSFGMTSATRLDALRELDKAKRELITLRYQIAFPQSEGTDSNV
jgi:hypothetical protein